MKVLAFLSLLLAPVLPAPAAPPTEAPRGTCYVCKYNNDLACVNFRLKPETPTLTYAGKTYVFCSTDCRDACAKHPEKYLPKK